MQIFPERKIFLIPRRNKQAEASKRKKQVQVLLARLQKKDGSRSRMREPAPVDDLRKTTSNISFYASTSSLPKNKRGVGY